MTPASIEKLVWVLIYGGLLLLSLGLFVARGDAVVGAVLTTIGAVAALVGAVLIWVRSRMTPPAPPTKRTP